MQYQWNFQRKIKLIFTFLALEIVLFYAIVFPIHTFFPIDSPHFDYAETFSFSIIIGVILVPLIEELIFRYVLRYKGLLRKMVTQELWNKIFPFLIYISAFSFGLIHISNIENKNIWHWLFSPFIMLSQFLGGFVISFIRVRLSFSWGVLYHSLWNLIFTILAFAYVSDFTQKTEKYDIKVQNKVFFDKTYSQYLKVDSLNGKINTLKVEQYSLRHLLDTLYGKNKYYLDDVLIDLEFYSKEGTSEVEFIQILDQQYKIRKNK